MRISFHAEEIEYHSLGFRKFPDHPHQFLLRNLCDLFIRRFGYLFLRRLQWLQIHTLGFSKVVYHHVHRYPCTPGFQRSRRLIFPNCVKDLYHRVVHEVARQLLIFYISDTKRIKVGCILCIQLMPGLFVPPGA